MASLRLTTSDYDGVVRRALDHVLAARVEAQRVEEDRIGRKAWELVFPQNERNAAVRMNKRWVRQDACLRFRFGFRAVRLQTITALPVPASDGYCSDLGLVEDEVLIAAFEAFDVERNAIKADRERLSANLYALVRRATTLKKLAENWPEGKPFYEHLKPREQAQVPAVQVEELNRMLGLASVERADPHARYRGNEEA